MGSNISTGAIVGIVVGCIGFVVLAVGCAFLKTVLTHRRRVRRAVDAAGATSPPPATRTARSRYPEAIPCENYNDLFPDEAPARGNVVFQSRAEIDRMRDVLVRIEDGGVDNSDADFSTTEMVSVNNSFAPHLRPQVHAGHMMQERLKPTPAMVSSRMGSFDNEHNVAMSFVSCAPTPASSMPVFGARSHGPLPSSSFDPGVGGSFASPPPMAKADGGAAAHFQDRGQGGGGGGLRLLVPVQERTRFGDAPRPRHPSDDPHQPSQHRDHSEDHSGDSRALATTPLTEGSFVATAQSYQPTRQPREGGPSLQDRVSANAASFSQHLAPSFSGLEGGGSERRRHPSSSGLRPPAVPHSMGAAIWEGSARSGLLGATRQDPLHLQHRVPHTAVPRKHKVRIHRQHRVRNVERGGYVVLEETESSSSDADGGEAQREEEEEGVQREVVAGGDAAPVQPTGSSAAPPSTPSSPAPETGSSSASPALQGSATAAAAAKKTEKKRRYYFEKLSSLDVYGRGQYLPGAGGGFPPMEGDNSSGNESDKETTGGPVRLATMHHAAAPPVYMSNSSRKPT